MSQAPDVVLVRQPGNRTYDTPAPVASMATSEWEYAVLSGNVYVDDWKKRGVPQPDAGDAPAATPEAYERRCTPDSSGPLPLPGWTRWDDFPSGDVRRQARDVGLFKQMSRSAYLCPGPQAGPSRGR